ncbi:ABC transporter ATP-binding protein [Aureimonas sp. AU12]|uniref:ABC transporter ATP-binding protein n=1 Tax=Aureimonas sp. AU12 TaxID=1638161 RepID=UPI0007862905|nr:ABC transporter ATP-binding protein [Aureimonas sp. AU12]
MRDPPQSLSLRGLTCRYGSKTALHEASFDVRPGEFVSILGPSGCGKSTLLRAIAGLEPVAAGEILVGGRSVEGLAPKDREVAFVFQSYALYPHMSCRDNLAAPLVMRELSAFERPALARILSPGIRARHRSIRDRVEATAAQLGITELLDRRPADLSGGQRQRVALGRALIREPQLFLLDEPLANLDAALRNRTRSDLRALQKRIGATTLFVTHDQSEAMAISDRVVVMFDGRVRQIGTPDELYRHPVDLDVARFLSQPHLNVIDAEALRAAIGERTASGDIILAGQALGGIEGVVAFRPEHAAIRQRQGPGLPGLPVVVDHAEHAGVEAHLFVRTVEGSVGCVIRIPSEAIGQWPPGSEGILHFALDAVHVFPAAETGRGAVVSPQKAVA